MCFVRANTHQKTIHCIEFNTYGVYRFIPHTSDNGQNSIILNSIIILLNQRRLTHSMECKSKLKFLHIGTVQSANYLHIFTNRKLMLNVEAILLRGEISHPDYFSPILTLLTPGSGIFIVTTNLLLIFS